MNVFVLLLMSMLAADTAATAPRAAGSPPANVAPASVIVHHQPAIPIVALRLSIVVDDPPGYAGAGHLIQHLHFYRLRQQADRVGGQVQIQRSSDAIVYTVIGPAAELEYLSEILHGALRAPTPSPGEMVVALRELQEERLAEWETAAAHVRASLRARLFPEELSPAGTESSAERFELSLIPALWGEIYQPERVSVVAVGDVELARVSSVFGDLPARPRQRLRRIYADTVPSPRLAAAESTRGWLGLGYSGAELDPVATTVAARMLRDVVRELIPTADVEVEHWWTHRGQAVVAALAVPEASLPAARRALGTSVAALQQDLTEESVRAAAVAIRREMLYLSRTPDQMAEVVGRFADRDGDPDSSQHFFDRLGSVDLEDVRNVVDQLATRTPARVDIPPQPLQRR
jgi:predicted Zn-dependent peptidase